VELSSRTRSRWWRVECWKSPGAVCAWADVGAGRASMGFWASDNRLLAQIRTAIQRTASLFGLAWAWHGVKVGYEDE
jgi:hypothetical protein